VLENIKGLFQFEAIKFGRSQYMFRVGIRCILYCDLPLIIPSLYAFMGSCLRYN